MCSCVYCITTYFVCVWVYHRKSKRGKSVCLLWNMLMWKWTILFNSFIFKIFIRLIVSWFKCHTFHYLWPPKMHKYTLRDWSNTRLDRHQILPQEEEVCLTSIYYPYFFKTFLTPTGVALWFTLWLPHKSTASLIAIVSSFCSDHR